MTAPFITITRRSVGFAVCETLLIVNAVTWATWIAAGPGAFDFWSRTGLPKAFLIAFVFQMCLYYADSYEFPGATGRDLVVRIVQAVGATSVLFAAIYSWMPGLMIGRGVFFVSSVLVIVLVAAWRQAFAWLTKRSAPRERLLVVGTGPAAVGLARELFRRHQELGIEIVGFIDPDPARLGTAVINPVVIGTIDDIPSIVRARRVDRVVVSLVDARGKLPMDKLLDIRLSGVTFDHLASVYEELTGKIAVENLRPSWLIFSSGFRRSRLAAGIKRLLDVVAALIGIVLAFPLMLLIAVAVKLNSAGPVLYRQQRVGQHGRVFTFYKFRSMRHDAEAGLGPVWAQKHDERVTGVGRVMRPTRLDELPQLWNVLIGDMSLVGPRPERPSFVRQLTDQIPFYGQRHVIRPGLTGWAQVRYEYAACVEDAAEKLQYDLFYVKNRSIALDFFIILSTIKIIIRAKGV